MEVGFVQNYNKIKREQTRIKGLLNAFVSDPIYFEQCPASNAGPIMTKMLVTPERLSVFKKTHLTSDHIMELQLSCMCITIITHINKNYKLLHYD